MSLNLRLKFLFLILPSLLSAQQALKEDIGIIYKNEFQAGIGIHTRGWGLTFKSIKNTTAFKKRTITFDWATMKHPKEIKLLRADAIDKRSFIYGKLNSIFLIRTGWGQQKTLFEKEKMAIGGVGISYLFNIGGSFAFKKPVYIDVLYPTNNAYEFEIRTERYNPEKHFPDLIYQGAPYFKGFSQTKLQPGLFAETGINFEYGKYDETPNSIQIGACIDIYPKSIPIMAFNKAENFFLTLYLKALFGKQWN